MNTSPEIVGRSTSRGLTEEQATAVTCMDPLVIIKSGPGSGKTSIVCGHVKYMLIPRDMGTIATPEQIIAIAYNRKAAYDIKERLHRNDPTVGWNRAQTERPPFIGTHHAFLLWLCYRFRQFLGYPLNIPRIQYLDEAKTLKALEACRKEAVFDRTAPVKPGEPTLVGRAIEDRTQEIFLKRCREQGIANYPLLIQDCLKILRDAKCRGLIEHDRFYLMIDEAQDLGTEEFAVYDAFPAVQKYLVGDPAQAITPIPEGTSLLTKFEARNNARVLHLTQNFRSFQPICTVSNQLIRWHRPELHVPKQTSVRTATYPNAPMVIQWRCVDQADQMIHLEKLIKYYAEGVNHQLFYNQVAVLYRSIAEGRHLQALLQTRKIPFREEDPNTWKNDPRVAINCVTLARITKIKGMEYPNVIIPFFQSHIWPGNDDHNFSRRLLYTGITRAEDTVHLLFHEHNGTVDELGPLDPPRGTPCKISPFMAEMLAPEQVIHTKSSLAMERTTRVPAARVLGS